MDGSMMNDLGKGIAAFIAIAFLLGACGGIGGVYGCQYVRRHASLGWQR